MFMLNFYFNEKEDRKVLEKTHNLNQMWAENAHLYCENNQKLSSNVSFHQNSFRCFLLFCPEVWREECQLVDSFLPCEV